MNKEQIKEAILGKKDCHGEETPLCQFSTFHPDMEMVEILLKGADINKSFNHQPMAWVFQFCEPNWDEMLTLLFKYKYHALHLDRKSDFESLLQLLSRVKPETVMYVLKIMKKHRFRPTFEQIDYINKSKEDFKKEFKWKDWVK
ncbi:MAG: hypothetical protein IKS41_03600 [Alphaproteobacteria bacterium]|nr:hypothetical protein [Alphaproteobacteria bacterium]